MPAPTSPPVPLAATATSVNPITFGTILHFGLNTLEGDIVGIIIDSYKRDGQYADTQEVTNSSGLVVGVRMQDFRANVSVDGRVLQDTPFTIKVGDTLTLNGDTIVIEQCSYSGQAKGFHNLSIGGKAYESVVGLKASGF